MVTPQPPITSTSTGKASIPLTAADKTRASMGGYWVNRSARALRFWHRRLSLALAGGAEEVERTTDSPDFTDERILICEISEIRG